MELGWLDVCLKVKDIPRSRDFYAGLGFQLVDGDGENWAVMVNGEARIGLYGPEDIGPASAMLNFRGANVHRIKQDLEAKGYVFDPQHTPNPDGTGSAILYDPDGYAVFFDTASGETKKV